jgi:hypothetical protein
MHPRDDVALRHLDLVVHTVSKKTHDVQVGLLDETDAASIALAFGQAQPLRCRGLPFVFQLQLAFAW